MTAHLNHVIWHVVGSYLGHTSTQLGNHLQTLRTSDWQELGLFSHEDLVSHVVTPLAAPAEDLYRLHFLAAAGAAGALSEPSPDAVRVELVSTGQLGRRTSLQAHCAGLFLPIHFS